MDKNCLSRIVVRNNLYIYIYIYNFSFELIVYFLFFDGQKNIYSSKAPSVHQFYFYSLIGMVLKSGFEEAICLPSCIVAGYGGSTNSTLSRCCLAST